MTDRPTNIEEAGGAARLIGRILDDRAEWLYVRDGRARLALRRIELDFRVEHGRLVFYCLSERGMEVWRVRAWEFSGGKLLLEASRGMGRERARLELIPRLSSKLLTEEIGALRRARCARLAELALASLPGAVIERAGLSIGARLNQPGSFARILLKHKAVRIALTGIVTEPRARANVDAFLSSALLWFERLHEKPRAPAGITRLWFVIEESLIEPLRERIALLRDDLRRAILIYEIDEAWRALKPAPQAELEELFQLPAPKITVRRNEPSETAARIVSLAPDAIDIVRARHGETLRFHGLAFARVRRVMRKERVWFGLNPTNRKMLDESTLDEWEKLLNELKEHRRAEAKDSHHALYKQSSEAWLESSLRREITRLDAALRLAPLHSQFRVAQTAARHSRPVDLLAIRRDGRLVVIELKVYEDREHVLQGADYWRRIEAYRRQGAIRRARLFDDAEISDEPPLLYLVAPMLRFHAAFARLARAINPAIEIYRFELAEDWRARVRVVRRTSCADTRSFQASAFDD